MSHDESRLVHIMALRQLPRPGQGSQIKSQAMSDNNKRPREEEEEQVGGANRDVPLYFFLEQLPRYLAKEVGLLSSLSPPPPPLLTYYRITIEYPCR
jgi:hypothetical protein